MKRSIKFLSVLLVLVFVFTLCACGKSKEQFVGEAAAKYMTSYPELLGSRVVGNLMSDDEKVIILDMQSKDGIYYNLAIVIERTTYTQSGLAYDYIPGETYLSHESAYDGVSAYLFSNAKKKLSLDVEKINSYLQ